MFGFDLANASLGLREKLTGYERATVIPTVSADDQLALQIIFTAFGLVETIHNSRGVRG